MTEGRIKMCHAALDKADTRPPSIRRGQHTGLYRQLAGYPTMEEVCTLTLLFASPCVKYLGML
jgi:hypothetical protein